MNTRKWEIYLYTNYASGNVQQGTRPVLVVQNDTGNRYSPTTIVVPLTTQIKAETQPTHVLLKKEFGGIQKDSMVLCEQITVVNQKELRNYLGTITNPQLRRMVDDALRTSLALDLTEE